MLRKLTETIHHSLPPFLAILFIAVGMPVIHPALHDHEEKHHIRANHEAAHLLKKIDDNRAHVCPICDFLVTGQLYNAGSSRIIEENRQIGKVVSKNHIFYMKTCPLEAAPRAPPFFTSL